MFSGKSKLVNRYLKSSKNWLHFCPFLLVKELSKNSTMRSILQPPVSVIEYVFFQVKFCKGFLNYKYSRVHFFAGLENYCLPIIFPIAGSFRKLRLPGRILGIQCPKDTSSTARFTLLHLGVGDVFVSFMGLANFLKKNCPDVSASMQYNTSVSK